MQRKGKSFPHLFAFHSLAINAKICSREIENDSICFAKKIMRKYTEFKMNATIHQRQNLENAKIFSYFAFSRKLFFASFLITKKYVILRQKMQNANGNFRKTFRSLQTRTLNCLLLFQKCNQSVSGKRSSWRNIARFLSECAQF